MGSYQWIRMAGGNPVGVPPCFTGKMNQLKTKNLNSFLLFLSVFLMGVTLPVYATETATVSGNNQVNFTPWRAPILPGSFEVVVVGN